MLEKLKFAFGFGSMCLENQGHTKTGSGTFSVGLLITLLFILSGLHKLFL